MENHFNTPAQVTALYAAAGAEKAGYVANKTLRKVYKKVGFVAR